jgi:hypothetical protein
VASKCLTFTKNSYGEIVLKNRILDNLIDIGIKYFATFEGTGYGKEV